MKRLLIDFLAALSLLLFIATIALWLRNNWREDLWGYNGPVSRGAYYYGGNISCAAETIALEWWTMPSMGDPPDASSHWAHYSSPVTPDRVKTRRDYYRSLGGFQFLGFFAVRQQTDPRPALSPGPPRFEVTHILVLPHWSLALLWAILPTLWLTRIRQNRRKKYRLAHGLCRHCGYDLRAHAPGATCPECATPVPATQPKP